MGDIVTPTELGLALQSEIIVDVADYLIGLAEGLVKPLIADHVTIAPWPAVATAAVVAAAGRAYRNPKAYAALQVDATRRQYNPEDFGVYLSDTDRKRLEDWCEEENEDDGVTDSPTGAFPPPLLYPDPARQTSQGAYAFDHDAYPW